MYCSNCGEQIPDSAKYCPSCGFQVAASQTPVIPIQTYGQIVVTFDKEDTGKKYRAFPVEVYSNYELIGETEIGRPLVKTLPCGQHEILLRLGTVLLGKRVVEISENATTNINFFVSGKNDPKATFVGNAAGYSKGKPTVVKSSESPICPKCGGRMNIQTVSEARKAGFGTYLLYFILFISLIGWLILIPLFLRKKTQTATYQVCQSCGYKKMIGKPA